MKTQCNPAVNCPVGGQMMPSVLKILFQQLRITLFRHRSENVGLRKTDNNDLAELLTVSL